MLLLWLSTGVLDAPSGAVVDDWLGGVPHSMWNGNPSLMEPKDEKGRFSRVDIPQPIQRQQARKPAMPMPVPRFGSAFRDTMAAEIASAQARLAHAEKNVALQHQYDQHHALLAAIEARALLDLVMERDAALADEAAEAFMAWLMDN